MISTADAPHSTWASICDGWRLASAPTRSVIQERMLFFMAVRDLTLASAGGLR